MHFLLIRLLSLVLGKWYGLVERTQDSELEEENGQVS